MARKQTDSCGPTALVTDIWPAMQGFLRAISCCIHTLAHGLPLSVALGRSGLVRPPDGLPSPSRSLVFESLPFIARKKRAPLDSFFLVPRRRFCGNASHSRRPRAPLSVALGRSGLVRPPDGLPSPSRSLVFESLLFS